jgi:hypothetical protein
VTGRLLVGILAFSLAGIVSAYIAVRERRA